MARNNNSTSTAAPANNGKKFLRAYVVDKKDENTEFWTRVGAAFPHEDGKGMTLTVTSGLSISGRIVLREAKPAEARGED